VGGKRNTRRISWLPDAVVRIFSALALLAAVLVLAAPAPTQAAFPGANGKIVFSPDRAIWSMNPDGTLQLRLTDPPSSEYIDTWDRQPAWDPDGLKIAFTRYWYDEVGETDNEDIYTMNADGSGQTNITNAPRRYNSDPSWSPDGDKIAFCRSGSGGITVMNADGSNPTDIPAPGCDPAWSPNGQRFAVSSSRDGFSEIYTMNVDGSGQTRLTNNLAQDLEPGWSPDGTKIAFSSSRDGNSEIYTMNVDGSGQTRLTNDPGADGWPAWSPDGTKIAFTRTSQIWVMNADGSGQTNASPLSGTDPDWQPLQTDLNGDVSVTKTDSPDPVVAGKTLTYTVAVKNKGPSPVTGTSLTDNLPASVTFESATSSQGSCTQAGGTVTCGLGTLGGGQTATVQIRVTPQTFGTIINSTTAHANETDPRPSNNTGWEGTAVRPYPTPAAAAGINLSLVPVFNQCGIPGRPANSTHGPPFSYPSCEPPIPRSEVATFGTYATGSVSLFPDPRTGDIVVNADLSDVKDLATGLPYNPNPSGPDLTMQMRLRITDTQNGASEDPGTTSDLDVSIPLECAYPSYPEGYCYSGLNAHIPAAIKIGKYTSIQVFRVRVDDAGQNGIRGDSDDRILAMQGLYIPGGSAPYPTPDNVGTSSINVAFVPVFKQCATGDNQANSTHGAPFSVPSCTPPVPLGVAQVGPRGGASAYLQSYVPQFVGTDVLIRANASDIQTQTQGDYNPNASGPDVALTARIRITDQLNGPSQNRPGTVVDFDFPVPADCAPTSDTHVGSACSVDTTANAVLPRAIQENKQMVIQTFTLRLVDSGPDGVNGNSDDALFAQEGLYFP
jgi:uncharacterized repeat protein (TIGR01451 family)